jgi:1-acyl-sn-glycerol-3-phosphate acyltransferase
MEPTGSLAARVWRRSMRLLASYHRWRVIGVEHVPRSGGAVITCTHSLATYDLFIMGCASPRLVGRQAYIVGDDLMFRIAGLAPLLYEIGLVPGGRESVIERLRQGNLIGIAPGGMEESLRDYRNRHLFDWSRRRGFVWVALKSGVPIVPAVCPSAAEIFTVYANPVTDWAYRRHRVPLPVFRGCGPTPLPRRVRLLSVVGEALYPDVAPDQVGEADVERMHRRVVEATACLLADAQAMRGRPPEGVRAYDFDGPAGLANGRVE